MFNKDDDQSVTSGPATTPRTPSAAGEGQATYIAAGVKIRGEIRAETDVTVDGEVEGRVQIKKDLMIGPQGVIKGEISARGVRVGGKVIGNVKAGNRFELLSSGRIEGDVLAPRVIIADGAFFKGSVEMTGAGDKS